jgi:biotin carboxyl carrier protein
MRSASTQCLTITVDGTPYQVELGDLTGPSLVVHVNGRPYNVTVETAADGSPAHPPRVAAIEPAEPVSRPETPPPSPHKPGEGGLEGESGRKVAQVTAPMPGNVLDIAVETGDRVGFRDRLCALEAMKMKTAIQSPRDGTIASVEVVEGQAVAHGDVLVTFE